MSERRRFRGRGRRPGELNGAATADSEASAISPASAGLAGRERPETRGPEAAAEGASGSNPARRRRRRRGGRSATGEGTAPLEAGSEPSLPAAARQTAPGTEGRGRPEGEEAGEGSAAKRPRRRRRRGRGQREDAALEAEDQLAGETREDFMELAVERGLPVLYRPVAPAEEEYDEEEGALEQPGRARARKINSGKLFWFIRSKSYVPIPEIRRRFEISANEMSAIQDDGETLYIGLPTDVAEVVANLKRQQKIGLECSPDFSTKVVIGIYPLRRV